MNIFWKIIQERTNNKHPPNQKRSEIKIGADVYIVEKHNQKSGILTKGTVKNLLTSKPLHTRGIKVRLVTGEVGRVQCIIGLQKCKKLIKQDI